MFGKREAAILPLQELCDILLSNFILKNAEKTRRAGAASGMEKAVS